MILRKQAPTSQSIRRACTPTLRKHYDRNYCHQIFRTITRRFRPWHATRSMLYKSMTHLALVNSPQIRCSQTNIRPRTANIAFKAVNHANKLASTMIYDPVGDKQGDHLVSLLYWLVCQNKSHENVFAAYVQKATVI